MSEGGRIEPGHRTASPAEIAAVRARVARARHPLGYVTELDGTEITGRALPRPGTEVPARPEVVPPDEPDADLKCAATDNGYFCTAARGHPAGTVHAAWGLPADEELCHTWPQSPPPSALTPEEAPPQQAPAATDFASECKVIATVDDAAGVLCCYLREGHAGPHFDKFDRLWWTTEDPPATVPPGESMSKTTACTRLSRSASRKAVRTPSSDVTPKNSSNAEARCSSMP